jgi:hypothetical protein
MSLSRQIAYRDVTPLADHPGYLANNWYIPYGATHAQNAGVNPGSGVIRLFAGVIKQTCTLSALGIRVTTLSAGGNVQTAIYANNPATMRPTGTALASTASISTASAAVVNATISVQLTPGLYWFASNMDNATSIITSVGAGSITASALIGSPTQANIMPGSAVGMQGVKITSTFGTWPDLTGQSFTDATGNNDTPLMAFKVGSVP